MSNNKNKATTDRIVDTVVPLLLWLMKKTLGPCFKRDEWRAVALSLVPPPDNVVNSIRREIGYLETPALLAPSYRRWLRNCYKRYIRHQFRDNGMVLQRIRQYFIQWRQALEATGHAFDPTRIEKLSDIEAEMTDYYAHGCAQKDLSNMLGLLDEERVHDATTLAWEFAFYGGGGSKPKLRRNSALWKALGLDPEQLENMSDADGFILFISRFMALLGLAGQPPDEPNLRRLLQWVVRTHLPPEEEPTTTPEARSKAIEAGLIHKGIVTRDKETGEVAGIDVEDPNATDFMRKVEIGGNEISGAEDRETITQAFALKGISYNDLTPGEWAEIFERYDLIRKGYEFSSKTGVSISSYYGAAANTKEQRLSRIRKKIRDVVNR